MNSTEKQAVFHCLKSMIDEEVCEECPLYGTTGTDHCEKDCVRLAINALEQEPCEDCVSRSAVLAIAGDSCLDLNSYEDTREFCDEIKELLPVTPQPKMGRWIEHFDESGKWYECDQCHTDWGGSVNYCPNCGSKM